MSLEYPTVSIILPTYNRGDIITDAIESVLNQTYGDFELIVVDDASTDNTKEVIDEFQDSRIQYIEHEENRGAPAARNTGLDVSNGEYIAFQDSDDIWKSNKLERQMKLFENSSSAVGVVYTGMIRSREQETVYIPYSGIEQQEGDVHRSLQRQNFIPTQVTLVRHECFDKVGGFDEQCWPISDWELWLRVSRFYQFKLVDEALVSGEVRSDSISRNRRAKVEARARVIEKHRELFDPDNLALHSFYVGHGLMRLNDERARTYLRQSVRLNPRALYIGVFILSHFPRSLYMHLYNLRAFLKDL